jgi:hypothetical protein
MRFETVKRIEAVLKLLADNLREQIKLELEQGDRSAHVACTDGAVRFDLIHVMTSDHSEP